MIFTGNKAMNKKIGHYLFIILFLLYKVQATSIVFVILSQPTDYFEEKSLLLKQSIENQATEIVGVQVEIYRTHVDFPDVTGSWAVWPLLPVLVPKINEPFHWLLVCEDETNINLSVLLNVLNDYDFEQEWFLGHGLRDQQTTIIHHYAFANENPGKFLYPDFAGGLALSAPLTRRLVTKIKTDFEQPNFAIDAKHELAMLIWENGKGRSLVDVPTFCTTKVDGTCATTYQAGYQKCSTHPVATDEDFIMSVKTFHKHHKSRIVVIKRTWAKETESIQYYSDVDDKFVPTINLGLSNTERGHCGKTMGIIKKFATNEEYENRWLIIVDDDTIISVRRLRQFLSCFNVNDTIIIGERYGYGFHPNGERGYDYPTGGSGMIFSPSAASNLAVHCRCPSLDSPDDMIIGMCAQSLQIPIIHSPAFHQARPMDYSIDYVSRIKPISFHKHWEVDPYKVYSEYLEDKDDSTTQPSGEDIASKHEHSSDEL